MNICQDHWDRLREAIKARGLGALISDGGERAAQVMARAISEVEPSVDNFDPLLNAWGAIGSNTMSAIQSFGGNPLVLMVPEGQGHEEPYPRCGICYLNWMMDKHDEVCTNPDCQKPKGEAAHYDWMIDRAADDQVELWKSLQS